MRPLPVERWTAPIRLTGAIAALVVGLNAAPASASFSFGLPAAAGLPPELTQDLVAFYPFDETAGTVVKDQSGNGRDAAIVNTNTTTTWSNGRGLNLPGGNGGTLPAEQFRAGLRPRPLLQVVPALVLTIAA